MTKLFVICNYENRSLLSQKLETLSQNYDLILPFWFEKETNIDRESFLEDVNRVRNCDIVLILGDSSNLYNNFLLFEAARKGKGTYCTVKNVEFSLLRTLYSISLRPISDIFQLPLSKYFEKEEDMIKKVSSDTLLKKCRNLLSLFNVEPNIIYDNGVCFAWESEPEDSDYLKYSVYLDIMDINNYNLRVNYYDEVVCDYHGDDKHIDYYVYLVNKYLEDFSKIFR